MLDEAVVAFLEQGLAIHLGTRNERLEPNGARVAAVKVDADRQHVVAYVSAAAGSAYLDDLRANGQVAIACARPTDDRACQVKGVFVSARDAGADEQAVVMAQWQGFLAQLDAVGLPGSSTSSWSVWPALAIRLRVTAVFNQTPGPDAGAALT